MGAPQFGGGAIAQGFELVVSLVVESHHVLAMISRDDGSGSAAVVVNQGDPPAILQPLRFLL